MKSLVIIFFVVAGGALGRLYYRSDPHSRSHATSFVYQRKWETNPSQIIRNVNAKNTTWRAGFTKFSYLSTKEKSRLLGSLPNSVRTPLPHYKSQSNIGAAASFDAREQWGNCGSIREVRNQGGCGSCWAVSTAAALSDHECIRNGNDIRISEEDVMSCTPGYAERGCGGGNVFTAWKTWVSNGFVTENCRPYTAGGGQSPPCEQQCANGADYAQDKHFGEKAYNVAGGEEQIKDAISNDGPVVTTFEVYEDFFNYKNGVYQHVEGDLAGTHAVKLLGWGEDNGTPYWLAANSWGTGWGEGGFFRILRGSDDCRIESTEVAGGVARAASATRHKYHSKHHIKSERSGVMSLVWGGWMNITADSEMADALRKLVAHN